MICPAEHELARALSCGADAALAAHLGDCARCRDAWAGFERAIRLARELPADVPPAAHREELRTALLASADVVPRSNRRAFRLVWIGVGVAAAATVALSLWRSAPAEPRSRAALHPSPGARYAVISEPPDEIVRLRDGKLDIDVDVLGPADRFRVVVGDDEVEVRGTSFEVTARADRLVGVRVAHGRVEVRPRSGAPRMLGSGEAWREEIAAPPLPAAASSAAASPAAPPKLEPESPKAVPESPSPDAPKLAPAKPPRLEPKPANAAPPTQPARAPEELAYNDAWDALRANDFRKAAAGFARVVALSPAGPLADDAAYWHAVALARGGRSIEAIAAFRALLDDYASSPRVGEASVMLGWLLVDANQLDESERRFRAAATDPSATVRASARSGLDALAARRR